jgi:hypothetical protein
MENPITRIEAQKKRVDKINGTTEEEISRTLAALPQDHKALELGQAIYRSSALPWEMRWRVAKECLKYETPTLGVVAQVDGTDFAALLDQRLKRMEEMKLIEQSSNGSPPRLPDRRFRRI